MNQKRINNLFLGDYATVGGVLLLAYVLEVVKGNRTLGYLMLFSAVIIVPFVLTFIVYLKNKESYLYPKLVSWAYFLLYAFVLFTFRKGNPDPIEFVYILPLVVILPRLHEYKFTLKYALAIIAINIAQVAYIAVTSFSGSWLVQAEIQIAGLALIMEFAILMCKQDTAATQQTLNEIAKEKEEAETQSANLREMGENIAKTVESVLSNLETVTETSQVSVESMRQVSDGTQITSESVQKQMEVIEELASGIDAIKQVMEVLNSNIEESAKEVKVGNENMNQLLGTTEEVSRTSMKTSEAVSVLDEKVKSISEIVGMISSIAGQTKMLALNASIEAARAGESGRGFAVVAEQIGTLSQNTSECLSRITEEMKAINDSTNLVIGNTNAMNEIFDKQNEIVQETSRAFASISEQTQNLAESSASVNKAVIGMDAAKNTIVDSAGSISAVSEETSANASETLDQTMVSAEAIKEVEKEIRELKAFSESM